MKRTFSERSDEDEIPLEGLLLNPTEVERVMIEHAFSPDPWPGVPEKGKRPKRDPAWDGLPVITAAVDVMEKRGSAEKLTVRRSLDIFIALRAAAEARDPRCVRVTRVPYHSHKHPGFRKESRPSVALDILFPRKYIMRLTVGHCRADYDILIADPKSGVDEVACLVERKLDADFDSSINTHHIGSQLRANAATLAGSDAPTFVLRVRQPGTKEHIRKKITSFLIGAQLRDARVHHECLESDEEVPGFIQNLCRYLYKMRIKGPAIEKKFGRARELAQRDGLAVVNTKCPRQFLSESLRHIQKMGPSRVDGMAPRFDSMAHLVHTLEESPTSWTVLADMPQRCVDTRRIGPVAAKAVYSAVLGREPQEEEKRRKRGVH